MTYTKYKKHNDWYTKIQGSIAINSSQVGLAHRDIILLSSPPRITYKTSTTHGVENRNLIHSRIPAGTYSINDFNTKIKEFVLQPRKDLEPSQIKGLKLVIPRDYTFWTDNSIFITLGIPDR